MLADDFLGSLTDSIFGKEERLAGWRKWGAKPSLTSQLGRSRGAAEVAPVA